MKPVKPRVKINTLYGESDGYQQKRIKQTLTKALNAHPRTALIRFDLRFPLGNVVYRDDAEVITRFFKSLNEKFPVYLKKRAERGVRVHNSELRYLWVREFNKVGGKHYHICLLVNLDTVCYVKAFETDNGRFYTMVADAWLSATGLDNIRYRRLVHIPKNPVYKLYKSGLEESGIDDFYKTISERIDYLIKNRQKQSGDGARNFGCSQK